MNVSKLFVKLNWEVFTYSLEKMLGCRSPKAQEYLKKCSEHEKIMALPRNSFSKFRDGVNYGII